MNGDQLAARASFGDANAAEPPTPEQSPTSAISPSAVFARPETGWTPACTDGYPIQGPFGHFGDLGELGELGDLGSTTSHLPSSALGPKRPLPFEGLAAETASKKARPGTSARESAVQQATTPPPSARKADHELASQPRTNAMQHGQGFDQPYFFMTAPTDVFGYPLAAPAAGPAFTDQRYVWDADSAMAGIDMDFATAGHAIFQSPAIGHRPMDSLDWAKIANLIFQESPAKREGETASADQGVFADAFSPPMPNIFGPVDWPVGCEGAVDPGLLFRQPPSLASEAIASRLENPVPPPGCSTPPEVDANSPDTPGPLVSRASMPSGVRRSAASVREIRPRWPTGQGSGSAPVKPAGGPVRSRSSSGSRGRKALPPLAPAPRPRNQDAVLCTLATRKATRATPEKPSRSVRVSSPLKCHHRLSSLSIPEASSPQMRTRAKFSIDADGRARVETTLIVEQDGVCAIRKKAVDQPMARQRHCEDEDESSSDEEPIIIPSRNTSFALPSLDKGPNKHTLRQLQRSFSGRHTSDLLVTLPGRSLDETDSEAETAMYNDVTPTSRARGDAARELRKMRDGRQQQDWAASAVSSSERRVYPAQHIPWPTRQSGTCLPTASTASRSSRVRCVCHSPQLDKPHGDVFMVQCDTCEMLLHSHCINMTRRTLTSIYICAFCAHTKVRDGGVRNSGRASAGATAPTSPLAHKSVKNFR